MSSPERRGGCWTSFSRLIIQYAERHVSDGGNRASGEGRSADYCFKGMSWSGMGLGGEKTRLKATILMVADQYPS